jgi:hypothetical protein
MLFVQSRRLEVVTQRSAAVFGKQVALFACC